MNPSSDSFINVVQIDGLVLLKIIKHCRESLPDLVTGQLLGLDFYSTLEVTHSYPLPSRPVTDEDEQAEVEDSAAAEFQVCAASVVSIFSSFFLHPSPPCQAAPRKRIRRDPMSGSAQIGH
eukprot:TRINITY_DN6819_c0_g3_i3.p1 TRINITY_DN6819_c0_g3~~TRINITY_DN6819_c0_g3_i3.p1  ORF type:complete len:121 (+),score=18.10 TRINITY_DN6819_c0_g3_i3:68-430(+)